MCKALGISIDKSIENNDLVSNLNLNNQKENDSSFSNSRNLSNEPMTDEEQEQWSKNMFENKNAKILFDKINEHKNLTYEDAQKIADLIDIITIISYRMQDFYDF